METTDKARELGPQTRSATAQKLTEKGHEYQRELKLKIFRQMLGKLEKDGATLLDDLTSQDEDGKSQEDAMKISRWKHNYITLLQTDNDLQPLLGADYEQHRTAHEQRLAGLETMRATIESLMPAQEESMKGQEKKTQVECVSVKSGSSRSRASVSSMKAQLYMMKVKEDQSAAELRMKAAALEEKFQMEREMKMIETQMQELKRKEERHKLDTELRIQQAKTEVIENMEREIDSSLLTSQKTGARNAQPVDGNQVTFGACLTDCMT